MNDEYLYQQPPDLAVRLSNGRKLATGDIVLLKGKCFDHDGAVEVTKAEPKSREMNADIISSVPMRGQVQCRNRHCPSSRAARVPRVVQTPPR